MLFEHSALSRRRLLEQTTTKKLGIRTRNIVSVANVPSESRAVQDQSTAPSDNSVAGRVVVVVMSGLLGAVHDDDPRQTGDGVAVGGAEEGAGGAANSRNRRPAPSAVGRSSFRL